MSIFDKKTENCSESSEVKALVEKLKRLELDHELELKRVEQGHDLILKQKDFELSHLETEKIKDQALEITKLTQKVAVLEKELELTKQIIELDADVIDVKELVSKLIEKLPEIKIDSLTVQNKQEK